MTEEENGVVAIRLFSPYSKHVTLPDNGNNSAVNMLILSGCKTVERWEVLCILTNVMTCKKRLME